MSQNLLAWLGGTPTNINLSALEAHGHQGTGSAILDVRKQPEWASGHVKTSKLVALRRLGTHVGRVARDAEISAVCTSGDRSSRAVSILRDARFEHAVSMRGGMTSWECTGLPVSK